jgi:uncharacterized cupin superfamily protein
MAKKVDLAALPVHAGSNYPAPFDRPCSAQSMLRLARDSGLTQFGVNLTTLQPGAWSSQRHWHTEEDEFVWVVEGELTLVTNAGEEILRPGDCAAFRRGEPDGHHLINRSDRPAKVLEIGTAFPHDVCDYPDIDMIAGEDGCIHRDGTPYPKR